MPGPCHEAGPATDRRSGSAGPGPGAAAARIASTPSLPSSDALREDRRHAARGPGAVRDRVLLGSAVLAEGPTAGLLGLRLEDRVVAEAAAPAGLDRDPAAAGPASGEQAQPARRRVVRDGQREHADISSTPPFRREALELAQQLR